MDIHFMSTILLFIVGTVSVNYTWIDHYLSLILLKNDHFQSHYETNLTKNWIVIEVEPGYLIVVDLNGHEILIENLNQFYNKIQNVQKRIEFWLWHS